MFERDEGIDWEHKADDQDVSTLGNSTQSSAISSIYSTVSNDDDFQYYVREYENWTNKQRKRIVNDLEPFLNNELPHCCKKKCSLQFSVRDVQKYRYDTLRENNQRKMMIMRLAIEEKRRNKDKKFIVCGRSVCTKFATFARGVSNAALYPNYIRTTSNQGVLVNDEFDFPSNEDEEVIHQRPRKERKRAIIDAFFKGLIEWNEKMPDVDEIHLPHGNKKELYFNFIADTRVFIPNFTCAYNYFVQVWKAIFPKVKLRKHSRFTLCDDCVKFKEQINSSMSESNKKIIRDEYYKHKSFIKMEKYSYYTKRYMATTYPNKCVSIIIDGSDMANYGLPFFYLKTKETIKGYKMQIKLIGVIVHGVGSFAFLVHKNWPSDPNLTIEVLHRLWKLIPDARNKRLFVQVN